MYNTPSGAQSVAELPAMVSTVSLVVTAAVLYGAYVYANGLRKNIVDARKSGLPYIVVRKSDLSRRTPNPASPSLLGN